MSVSLTKSALSGVAWNWAGSAVLVVAQVASTAATARLVAPSEFGAYATAQALTGLAGYFTLTTVGSALLRRRSLDSETVGTATTVSLVVSLPVALGVWLGASAWARAWHVPEATWATRVLAIVLVLTASGTVPVALIRHRLRFGTAAAVETGMQVLGLGVGVAIAVDLHSAVALALGQLAGAAGSLVLSAAISRHDLRLRFSRSEARELLRFSGQVSLLNFGAYVGNTAPGWFAARAYGAAVLGVYSRASLIVGLPLTYLTTGVMKVLYPLYGRVRGDAGRTRALLEEGLVLSTGFAWPFFAYVAGTAPVVVGVLLGDRWRPAATLVAVFAAAACGGFPCSLLTNAAEAFGWMRLIAMRQLALLAGIGVSIAVVAVAGLDVNWLVVGIAATQWLVYGLTLVPFVERGVLAARALLRTQSIHATTALFVFGAAIATRSAVSGFPLALQVACLVALAIAVGAALVRSRSWFPAAGVLERRLAQIEPGETRFRLLRLGAAAR